MKAKFQNSSTQRLRVWSRHEHECSPQARKESTKCAVGPDEPEVAAWKDTACVEAKMPGAGGVLKRDYFCLLVSASLILVFNLSHSFN